jgi:hypothetical protein
MTTTISDDKCLYWDGQQWLATPLGTRLAQLRGYGWKVIGRGPNHYELGSDRFNIWIFFLLLLFGLFPGVIYAIVTSMQSQSRLRLSHDEQGQLV